jgi:tetratricopeptide (TPR) repeat protein
MGRVDGESVAGLMEGKARRDPPSSYAETFYPKWHYGWSELKSIRGDRRKYVDAPKPELYDLRTDPAERLNVAADRGTLVGGMSGELSRIAAGFGAAATIDAPKPDADTLARLRSLGYVGMAAPATPAGRGPDPKDMIAGAETFRSGISRAMDALARDQSAAAIAQLKQLLTINDRSYELHLFLGDAYTATRQFDNALGEYAAARLLNPRSAAPPLSAARAYLAQGDTTRALQQADEAAAIEPGSGDVRVVRGRPNGSGSGGVCRRRQRQRLGSAGARAARQPCDADAAVRSRGAAVRGAAAHGISPLADALRPRPDRRRERRHRARDHRVSRGDPPRAIVRRREDGAGQAGRVRWRVRCSVSRSRRRWL